MKLKDYFIKLKTQGKITNEDFDKNLETLTDVEIPDVLVSAVEEKFLTRERALGDKDVYRRVYAEALNGVDATISGLLPSLSKSDQVAISGEVDTFKKIKMLDASYKKQLDDLKKNSPDASKLNEEYQKNVRELTEKLELVQQEKDKITSEVDKKVKDITAQKDKELKQYKLKTDITGKLAQIELAKEFTENPIVKDTIFNGMLDAIMKNELDYDDQGRIVVQEIENGVAKPKFNGNDQVTLDKLLETTSTPYLKRNNSDGNSNGDGKEKTTTIKPIHGAAPKTLREMQQAKAGL